VVQPAGDAKGGESFGSRLAGIYSDGLKGIGNDIVGGAIQLLNAGAKAGASGEGFDPNDVGNVPIWQPFTPKDPAVAANFVEAFRPAMIAAAPEGAGVPAEAQGAAIQFGRVENQISHTFRHVEAAGFDRTVVENAIRQDLNKAAKSLSAGQYNGSVVVNGTKLDYSAFKLKDGTINVGRITPPKQ
jgi:hypothetical protein